MFSFMRKESVRLTLYLFIWTRWIHVWETEFNCTKCQLLQNHNIDSERPAVNANQCLLVSAWKEFCLHICQKCYNMSLGVLLINACFLM